MKRTATLLLGLTLAVPALAKNVKSIEWLPGQTVRIGSLISAAYRATAVTGQSSEIWLSTDCRTGEKKQLFINAQPLNGFRLYATDVADLYTPAQPIEPAADSPLMTTPGLELCKENVPEARWAGLSSAEQGGDRLFIDVNNSLRDGTMLKARLATDYDKIHYDEKYGAPYSVKIQDVMLYCAQSEGMTIGTFLLDNQGLVTDAASAKDIVFTKLTPEMADVAKTLCAIRDLPQYKGTGMLKWRNKEVAGAPLVKPDFEHNTPVGLQRFPFPAPVVDIIEKTYADPQQKPAFRTLTYTQSGPEKSKLRLEEKVDVQPDGTTLSITKMTLGGVVFYSQNQRLFNIVDVKKWDVLSEAPWVSKTLESDITLPLKPGKIYSSRGEVINRDKPGTEKTLSQTCVAGKEWHNAADIHPSFPGRYLELICKEDLGDGRNASSDYAYFEDLRLFIRIGYQDEGGVQRFTYSDVTVVR